MNRRLMGVILSLIVCGCKESKNGVSNSQKTWASKTIETQGRSKITFEHGISVQGIQDAMQSCLFGSEISIVRSLALQMGITRTKAMYSTYETLYTANEPTFYPKQVASEWSFDSRPEQINAYQVIDFAPGGVGSEFGLFLPSRTQLQTDRNEIFPIVSYETVIDGGMTDSYGAVKLETQIVNDLSIQSKLNNASEMRLFHVETNLPSHFTINVTNYLNCLSLEFAAHQVRKD